jgi:predicted transposase YbfD/YdcC
MTDLTPDQLHSLGKLKSLFATLPDARQAGKVAYRLDEVLMMALCAMLSDCGDFTEMELFAETQHLWLSTFLTLPNGTPSHDVFRNVFMALTPEALLGILTAWGADLSGHHIAIDGKALRGTWDAAAGKCLVHVLRAWVDAHGLSAGQVSCAEKSNEVEAIPRLLDALQLKGAVVTIDAAGTQCAIAEQIHEAGAGYVLSLKANQKNTLAAVKTYFAGAPPTALQSTVTLEKKHGRCERREYSISEDLAWFHKSWKWPGLLSVGRVRRVVQREKTGPPLTEVHYYLCTIPADAKALAALVRGHWSVENRCHWVLDVVFGEDHSQVRDTTAAHNLSILREMALKALRNETSKGSLRSKRKRASLDPAFRLGLLLALQA